MNENLFLLYNHYGIKETFTDSQIIFHAVNRSYRDFWRQIHFHDKNVFNQDTKNEYKSESFLAENLPRLFESENQQDFDKTHYVLCNTLIHMYDGICKLSYGIAQRLINQTLIHLIVIESNLQTGYWDITATRRFFHVPVETYTLQMATAYGRDTYKHVLHLKCAPLEDVTNRYHMGYYNIEKVLPFEEWEFPEYIEYQTTLRKTITESSYADPVDWWFQAFCEVAGTRFTHIRENR